MNGQKLEAVTSFKYLGATLCKDATCSATVRIRIAPGLTAMARLNRIQRFNSISFASKFKLDNSLVISILLYGCETWSLLADSEKRIQAFEAKCLKISSFVGPQEPLLAAVKRQKLALLGHITRTMASPESFFRAPWRVSVAVVGRGNAVRTTSKNGHPCPCQNCLQGPRLTGRGSLLSRPSVPPDDPVGQGTELN